MANPLAQKQFYEFGPFRLDADAPLLLRSGELAPLPPKALDLLVVLVGRRGRLVPKDELISAVWPDTFVEESNLTHHISVLRKTLGSLENGQEYVETVPKRGYRFAGPVREVPRDGQPADIGPRLVSDTQPSADENPEVHVVARPAVAPRKPASSVWYVTGALLLVTALAMAVLLSRKQQPQSGPIRFIVTAPEKTAFAPSTPVISPDGTRLAFVASSEGHSSLWIRSLDSVAAQPLSGTEGAFYPFWSPDGRFIGFFAQGKLKKIGAAGGPVQTLCTSPGFGAGATWNRDGAIIFAGTANPLRRVSAAGGVPAPVGWRSDSRPIHTYWWPYFLPDGRHFLYLSKGQRSGDSGIYVGSLDMSAPPDLDPKQSIALVTTNAGAVYVPSSDGRGGHLLFLRDGTLMAQRFDAGPLKMTGDPFPVVEQMGGGDTSAVPPFSVSQTGVLAYRTGGGGPTTRLVWFDRTGQELGWAGAADAFSHPSLSPDEKRILLELPESKSARPDIWMIDSLRGATSRLTFDSATHKEPLWSIDGNRVIFESNPGGVWQISQIPVAETGREEVLVQSRNWIIPTGILDNRFLVYHEQDPKTKWDIWVLPLTGDRKPAPFLQTPFSESHGQFSPDGRWMAYESNESGRWEVYVQSFPASGAKWLVSTGGGVQPRWRRDGKELFYLSLDETLMAVGVKPASPFEAGRPKTLFHLRPRGGSVLVTQRSFEYDVSRDGQRFLINTSAEQVNTAPITVVLNWTPKS